MAELETIEALAPEATDTDPGLTATVRAEMVTAARGALEAHAPHPWGAMLRRVEPLEVTFRVAGDGEKDGTGTRCVPADRTDTGLRRVEVSIGPEDGAPGALMLACAVAVGLCEALPVGGLSPAKERKLAAKALTGSPKALPSLSVRDMARAEMGETSALARAKRAAEEARAGRPIGTARALPAKRTGGRLMLRYPTETGFGLLSLPRPGLLPSTRLGDRLSVVARYARADGQERGDEITLESGVQVYVPNERGPDGKLVILESTAAVEEWRKRTK
jgi:hypothetical protein